MWQTSPRSRMTSQVSSSLEKRLSLYSLAASTAGLGVLTLANPAEAKIIYTPANVKIVQNGGLVNFDLNHDGIADFGLRNFYSRTSALSYMRGDLQVVPAQSGNEIWAVPCNAVSCAAALPKNVQVGPKGHFHKDSAGGLIMAFANNEISYGPWLKVKQAYLGLKFVIKGKVHFGWARVKVSTRSVSISATLTGYAYETISNKPIVSGRTHGPDVIVWHATLGKLAAGKK